ncbi:rhodanese-like domain-containing protein [Comamonas sp. JUb58]|uniref:rhodanese-like domain-containing protein n=1 Tax=Comamonas sp. JUb58 TaxID=2485114 RepID=UPI00105E22B6|nr:rhodanese-like domain-containing protein [Comamonas sp. JUb58]
MESESASAPSKELGCSAAQYAAQTTETPALAWPVQAAPLALDQACWISAAEAAATHSNAQSPTLVDVRPRSLQRAAPIARALQLELSDIASKRFLQQTPVVLVGTGLDNADVDQACRQLRQQGFAQLQAVRGGVRAWQAAQVGAASSGPLLQPLDAQTWIAALGQGMQWTVIAASEAMQRAPQAQWPVPPEQLVAVQVEGKERDAKLVAAIARAYQDRLKRASHAGYAQALVVITDGVVSDALRVQVEAALVPTADASKPGRSASATSTAMATLPAYWLGGGWQAYAQQVAQTAAIQQTANHRLQAPCGRL